jgi:Cellulase (glycosyl hydrolase family 5)
MLRVERGFFVDARGNPVQLRGVNLGNWLLIEPWMLKWYDIPDQHTILRTLQDRFGKPFEQSFLRRYRDAYIGPSDFDRIRQMGFNCVRLPIDYRLLVDDAGQFKPDEVAYREIDFAIQQCERARLYVILDLHAAPGGQSDQMHTGQAGQNQLWSDPAMQDLTVEVWKRLAARYKSRGVIAALDLLNEPWGDHKSDIRPQLDAMVARLYLAVRSTGNAHVVLLPGAFTTGIAHYGLLQDRGFDNAAFTDHFYPGLFTTPANVQSVRAFLDYFIPAYANQLAPSNAAMLVGEYNIVLHPSGGDRMMRTVKDAFESRGWAHTLWSYKSLSNAGVEDDNWYVVTNATPLPAIDVRTSSQADIEAWLTAIEHVQWVQDEAMLSHLFDNQAHGISWGPTRSPPKSEGPTSLPDGWQLSTTGHAVATAVFNPPSLHVLATAQDINSKRDEFAFVHRACAENDSLIVKVDSLVNSGQWTKAGLMIRFQNDVQPSTDEPFVLLNLFPDGTLAMMVRNERGRDAIETKRVWDRVQFLRLTRNGSTVVAEAATHGRWRRVGEVSLDLPLTSPRIGIAVTSDSAITPTLAEVQVFHSASPPDVSVDADEGAKNLLANPSFEASQGQADIAQGWNRWGDWINREVDWTPTAEGSCLIGYHHWRIESPQDSGLWQDVSTTPGKDYEFSIRLQADAHADAAQSVTIALECTVDGRQVVIAERSVPVVAIESTGAWSTLRLRAHSLTDSIRVVIRITPKQDAPRGGAIKLDHAKFIKVESE